MIFGKIFGKGGDNRDKSRIAPLNPSVAQAISNSIGLRSIPSMPSSAHHAFKLSTDPTAEARDFVEVIEADEALAARVVRIANSVYFDRGKKSSSVEEAVMVIGTNELKSLMSANTLTDIFPVKHPLRDFLWSHDVGTAIVSRTLAQKLLPGVADSAFLAGLMHDIGKLLLLQRCGSEYIGALQKSGTQGKDIREIETQIYPFDHTEVGHLIAERWQFADDITASIRTHHDPHLTGIPLIVKCADVIAHAAGLGYPDNFSALQNFHRERLADTLLPLGINATESEMLRVNAIKSFELEADLYLSRNKQ